MPHEGLDAIRRDLVNQSDQIYKNIGVKKRNTGLSNEVRFQTENSGPRKIELIQDARRKQIMSETSMYKEPKLPAGTYETRESPYDLQKMISTPSPPPRQEIQVRQELQVKQQPKSVQF